MCYISGMAKRGKNNEKEEPYLGPENYFQGKAVFVEVQLQDGSCCGYLGEVYGMTATDIAMKKVIWIKNTGRRSKFMAGEFDDNCHYEVNPPHNVQSVPRWGTHIYEWPYSLDRKNR